MSNVDEFFKNLERAAAEAWQDVCVDQGKKLAEKFKQTLIANIKAQKYPMKALNPDYAEYKRKNHLDPRILIATEKYLENIEIKKEIGVGEATSVSGVTGSEAQQVQYVVKPSAKMVEPPKRKNFSVKAVMKSPLTYEKLGKIHEHGSAKANIPRRPHFSTTAKEFNSRAAEHGEAIQREYSKRVSKLMEELSKRT